MRTQSLAQNTSMIQIQKLDKMSRFCDETHSFNIYLFESESSSDQKWLQKFDPNAGQALLNIPVLNGYHICFREELIFMLQCGHIEPFNPYLALGNHLVLALAHEPYNRNLSIVQRILCLEQRMLESRLLSLVKVLIVQIARECQQVEADIVKPLYKTLTCQYLKLLNSHLHQRRSVEHYADLLSVSKGRLNHALLASTGFTANQLIQKMLIYRAKEAAISGHTPMKEIACNLGFGDLAHFSKFFRQNAGMTYSSFRYTFRPA